MPRNSNFKASFLLAVTGISLAACKNDLNGNGTVNVQVTHMGQNVSRALVYLNRDSTYHPDSLNDEFDKQERADANGVVHFDNIEPGRYYLYAEGRESLGKSTVWGIDSIDVKKRQRQNSYDIEVRTIMK